MDIALVFPGCHRRGGVERLVYEAARHYGREHDVTVYAQEFEKDGLEHVRCHPISIRNGPALTRPLRFRRDVRDALGHARHERVVSFGVSGPEADVLWVNSVHAAWLEHRDVVPNEPLRSSPLRRFLPRHQVTLATERRYFEQAGSATAIAVSDRVADDISRIYGFDEGSTVVVHNGFDPAEFGSSDPAVRSAVRAEIGVPQDAIVLLLVANELSRKGLAVLLEAVSRVGDASTHVLLVGRADPRAYRDRIEALGLRDRFHYAGSRSDLGAVHRACDVFVLPTRYEAFCLAIVEALASGLPVITTNVPGARDLVVDGVNGRLQHDPADSRELASILKDAIADRQFERWGANAPPSVRDHTWRQLLDTAFPAIESASRRRR